MTDAPPVAALGGSLEELRAADATPVPRPAVRERHRRQWAVPAVEVVVEVGDATLEQVGASADSVLASTVYDLRVRLVGPWDRLTPHRVSIFDDPDHELRLVQAEYRAEPRVVLALPGAGGEGDPSAPAGFRLDLPVGTQVQPDTVERLLREAEADGRAVARYLLVVGGEEVAVPFVRLAPRPPGAPEGREGERWDDAAAYGMVHADPGSRLPAVAERLGAVRKDALRWRRVAEQRRAEAARLRRLPELPRRLRGPRG